VKQSSGMVVAACSYSNLNVGTVIVIGGLNPMGLAKPTIITLWALKRSVLYRSQLSTDYQCSEVPILFQSPNSN
jgi:hypothetical protein